MATTTGTMTSANETNGSTELPPLAYEILTSEDERRDALHLVTDSIAQQRQLAAISVIFHPAVFALLVAASSAIWAYAPGEPGTKLISVCGLIITFLVCVRMLTAGYIHAAEDFNWKDFISGKQGDDVVFGARFGDNIIGALVLRIQKDKKEKTCTASIRAWTTKMRYRGRGVGGDLLRLAVAKAKHVSPNSVVIFDPNHANSLLPLHSTFNRAFKSRDEKARRALAHALHDAQTDK